MPARQSGGVSHTDSVETSAGTKIGEASDVAFEAINRAPFALRQFGGVSHAACAEAKGKMAIATTGAGVTGVRSITAVSAVRQLPGIHCA